MTFDRRIVLQLPLSNPGALGPFVEDCLRDGVKLIAVVGENAAAVEDSIDDFIVGDGSVRNRFIVTSAHDNETVEEVMEFAATFNAEDGESVQLVRL
jgi:hypothetical protein